MKKWRIAQIVGLALAIGLSLAPLVQRESTAAETVVFRFDCAAGTITIERHQIEGLTVVRLNGSAIMTAYFSADIADELSALTEKSIGSECHFYANDIKVGSPMILTKASEKMIVTFKDGDYAEELVEAFNSSYSDE